MEPALAADLAALKGLRIFFGHQSVGANILDGLRELLQPQPDALPIVTLDEQQPHSGSGIVHALVGRNEQPGTKCDDFGRLIDTALAGRLDIALLKWCYVDVDDRSDAAALFARYRSALDGLAARHPQVTFVPVTMPLRQVAGGLGTLARQLLGRPNRAKLANLRRHAFNEMLRQAYAGRPIFDLARAEATRPDGRVETFTYEGARGESLPAAYTDDGGHLNRTGRAAVAAAMVRSLAAAARTRTAV